MGWRAEESTNDTYVDVQVWWEGLSDLRLAERSEVGRRRVGNPGQATTEVFVARGIRDRDWGDN